MYFFFTFFMQLLCLLLCLPHLCFALIVVASCFILKLLTLCFQCLCLLQGCFQITCLCIESPVSSSSLLSLLVDLPWSLPSICLCVSSIFSFFFNVLLRTLLQSFLSLPPLYLFASQAYRISIFCFYLAVLLCLYVDFPLTFKPRQSMHLYIVKV